MCKQRTYPVWFSCRRKSHPVESKDSLPCRDKDCSGKLVPPFSSTTTMFSYVCAAAVLVFVRFVEVNNELRIRFGAFFNGGQFTLSTQWKKCLCFNPFMQTQPQWVSIETLNPSYVFAFVYFIKTLSRSWICVWFNTNAIVIANVIGAALIRYL